MMPIKRTTVLASVLLLALALISVMALERQGRYATRPSDSAVGISLTTTYGVVASRNVDGSFENIATIDGNAKYKALMSRLAKTENTHPSPPYSSAEDMWSDAPRQYLRSFRKAIRLPASADVGILSEMLRSLTQSAEHHLGVSVDSTVVAYPRLAAFYEEDIVDAASYSKLVSLRGYHLHQPRNLIAAYAGHGLGLCEHFEDVSRCQAEGLRLPSRQILMVECTDNAMILHTQAAREALDLADPDSTALSYFGDESCAPERVASGVSEILERRFRYLPRPSELTVLLAGDRSTDADLQKIISETVQDFGPRPRMIVSEPIYMSARGAAELAWRSQRSDETKESL